ncbi:SGNH/GDSL hydrolase family protein [Urechidicola croceus]|uniref:SGNH hydrolase-type esterase domain-containing protein n=1 Tax=Urechidicola croceus TaxID=1850246 RepID=A0A1D8P654_9FLAO|nr:SGNH/GDSL hydrolase family protein [Urechidicola croceus]AOW20048.1 hypothetical protein LPB138_04840 [Urechidicola croceus]
MRFVKKFLILLFSFLGTLFFCELFISSAKIAELSFAEYYDDIGKGLLKSREFVNFNEGFSILSTNEYRFVGDVVSKSKPKNTIRVALIGDSFVQGAQMFERHTLSRIMEDNLRLKSPNKVVEVLNFGRAGFNVGHMYAYQKLLIEDFEPDYFIYFLSKEDLVSDYSFPPLLPRTDIINDSLSISINVETSELNKYQNTKFLTQNFTFFNILNACRYKVNQGETGGILFGKFYSKPQIKIIESEHVFEFDPITSKIFENLSKNTIIINSNASILPIKVEEKCVENGLLYWDMTYCFDELQKSGIIFNEWKATNKLGHWNQYCHQKLGIEIANKLNHLLDESD